MAEIKITWKKSCIGFPSKQERIIESLGLKRLHHSVIHQDSPTIMGMVNKVIHLVQVEEVLEETKQPSKQPARAKSTTPKTTPAEEKVESEVEDIQPSTNTAQGSTIESLGLSVRTLNILKKADISSVDQITQMTDAELLSIPSFGAKSLDELREKIGTSK